MKYAIGVHHRLFPGRPASQRGTLLVRNNCYGQTLLVINKQEKSKISPWEYIFPRLAIYRNMNILNSPTDPCTSTHQYECDKHFGVAIDYGYMMPHTISV